MGRPTARQHSHIATTCDRPVPGFFLRNKSQLQNIPPYPFPLSPSLNPFPSSSLSFTLTPSPFDPSTIPFLLLPLPSLLSSPFSLFFLALARVCPNVYTFVQLQFTVMRRCMIFFCNFILSPSNTIGICHCSFSALISYLQCFDAVGWAAGRASCL